MNKKEAKEILRMRTLVLAKSEGVSAIRAVRSGNPERASKFAKSAFGYYREYRRIVRRKASDHWDAAIASGGYIQRIGEES